MGIFQSVTFTAKINKRSLTRQINNNLQEAQEALDSQVLSDSNYFIPKDTGMLEDSGIGATVIGSGQVQWSAEYAKKQYYGIYDHSKQRNPNGQRLWFEAAKARFLEKWRRLVNAYISRN